MSIALREFTISIVGIWIAGDIPKSAEFSTRNCISSVACAKRKRAFPTETTPAVQFRASDLSRNGLRTSNLAAFGIGLCQYQLAMSNR
jgi:hypothetical protein